MTRFVRKKRVEYQEEEEEEKSAQLCFC